MIKKKRTRYISSVGRHLGLVQGTTHGITDLSVVADAAAASMGICRPTKNERWSVLWEYIEKNAVLITTTRQPVAPHRRKKKYENKGGFYMSREWRKVRYEALLRDGAHCQCCGNKGGPGHPLHVDHIKPRSVYPELELSLSNLQVLCEDCNLGKLARDDTDWRSFD